MTTGYDYVAARDLYINNVHAFAPGMPVPNTTVTSQGWAIGPDVTAPGGVNATPQLLTTSNYGSYLRPDYASQNNNFRQIPVVQFHNFASSTAAQGVIKDYLAFGYTPIFYSEMANYLATGDASNLPAKPVVFTDDDGGASAYSALYPAMQALGVKCTFFLVPDWIDGLESNPPNGGTFMEATAMTWANCQEMLASGLAEFQSHTLSHGSMSMLSGPRTFSGAGEGAGADYLAAKARIESQIPGVTVNYNGCPFGVINETAIASLKAAGCKGNRISQCGKGLTTQSYDGSGPGAYVYSTTDPFRVPIADGGSFKYVKRHAVYGTADVDGNMVNNPYFIYTQRGWTLPTGWSFASGVTMPSGAKIPDGAALTTGFTLHGAGTAAATGAYHTDMIPVGFFGAYTIDWWMQCSGAPANSAALQLDCFVNPSDTVPVATLNEVGPAGGTTPWTSKRWYVLGDNTYAWIRPRWQILGATTGSTIDVWGVRIRRIRSRWHGGI